MSDRIDENDPCVKLERNTHCSLYRVLYRFAEHVGVSLHTDNLLTTTRAKSTVNRSDVTP